MSDINAAPSSTEPSIIEEIKEGMHTLEQKVEGLIHPDHSAEVAQPGEAVQTSIASGESSSVTSGGEAGNVASVVTGATNSAAVVSDSVASSIRARTQAIRGHLQGFEQSSVEKIVGELEAIERLI